MGLYSIVTDAVTSIHSGAKTVLPASAAAVHSASSKVLGIPDQLLQIMVHDLDKQIELRSNWKCHLERFVQDSISALEAGVELVVKGGLCLGLVAGIQKGLSLYGISINSEMALLSKCVPFSIVAAGTFISFTALSICVASRWLANCQQTAIQNDETRLQKIRIGERSFSQLAIPSALRYRTTGI